MSRGSYRGRSSLFVIWERFVDSLKTKNLKPNTKHIGSDYLGNHYFETQSKELFDKKQTKRSFKPPNQDLWDRPLPPEWNSWLRMSRTDPPTDEEIEYNLMIQRKKQQMNAKTDTKIEAKVNPYSTFPVYPEYEEYPQKNDK